MLARRIDFQRLPCSLLRFRDFDLSYALDGIGEHLCVLLPKFIELRRIQIGDRGLKFFHG